MTATRTARLTVRLPLDMLDALDELADAIAASPRHRAIRPSRTSALILALAAGIPIVRAECKADEP